MSVPVVLIPGAGGQAWVWHLVEADLRQRGYDAFAVDLPAADESKGLPAYADALVSAVGHRPHGDTPVTIAASSLRTTAPLVWQRTREAGHLRERDDRGPARRPGPGGTTWLGAGPDGGGQNGFSPTDLIPISCTTSRRTFAS
jgi:pimeloyl-ACP methyl ester carboxylesterase